MVGLIPEIIVGTQPIEKMTSCASQSVQCPVLSALAPCSKTLLCWLPCVATNEWVN